MNNLKDVGLKTDTVYEQHKQYCIKRLRSVR